MNAAGLPRMLITGASGFIGRRLVPAFRDEYEIYGLARRSQLECGIERHPNVHWYQADIGDRPYLEHVFAEIRSAGRVDIVLHLAAHYDFTGEDHSEYERTNVFGLRNVLDLCRRLEPRRFIFSSSLAACSFPPAGRALTEASPPNGEHIYARTKAAGERMVREYEDAFPSVIVRFAALFSDWCEYPPLYMFLRTWLSGGGPGARILGGRGESAIPYMHVKDAVLFLRHLLARLDDFAPAEVVLGSTDGAVSHRQLYFRATHYHFEEERPPILVPKPLVGTGIRIKHLLLSLLREECFERPWMARYVDKKLTVDASHTRARLGWQPRGRLEVLRRLPYLLENRRANRVEWIQRNRDAIRRVEQHPNLKICALLDRHVEEIGERCTQALSERFGSYSRIDASEHRWHHRLILRHLTNAVRTRVRGPFLAYCRDLAERRIEQGFSAKELNGALDVVNHVCITTLLEDEESAEISDHLYDHITMTLRLGCDQLMEVYEEQDDRAALPRPVPPSLVERS